MALPAVLLGIKAAMSAVVAKALPKAVVKNGSVVAGSKVVMPVAKGHQASGQMIGFSKGWNMAKGGQSLGKDASSAQRSGFFAAKGEIKSISDKASRVAVGAVNTAMRGSSGGGSHRARVVRSSRPARAGSSRYPNLSPKKITYKASSIRGPTFSKRVHAPHYSSAKWSAINQSPRYNVPRARDRTRIFKGGK